MRLKPEDKTKVRNECVGGNAMFCEKCGWFFEDPKPSNSANYYNCKRHKKLGLKGYKL